MKILVLVNFNCKPDGSVELIMLKHAVVRSLDYSIPGTDQVVRDGAHKKWCAETLFVNPEREAKIQQGSAQKNRKKSMYWSSVMR